MNSRAIRAGILGGLGGGLVFGAMMGAMGMLPMVGKLVGQPSAGIGFVVHLVNSAIIGGAFGFLFDRAIRGLSGALGYGLTYGTVWWLLGPLTLMPFFLGMGFGVNWNLEAATKMLPSLMGHVIFGGLLGAVFYWERSRVSACDSECSTSLDGAKSS